MMLLWIENKQNIPVFKSQPIFISTKKTYLCAPFKESIKYEPLNFDK